eukprot:3158549-Prymnesium_polylepis.2
MSRNVERLQNGTSGTTVANLKEALRIRLSILNDNVQGFVSAEDIDRRDRYTSMETLLSDVANATGAMPEVVAEHMNKTIAEMRANLAKLNVGLSGQARKEVEAKLDQELRSLRADLRGEEALPGGYCGSCYGAAPDPAQCCNTCDDIRAAYRQRRWGFPDENSFEQCRRDVRLRHNRVEEGEGCNLFGTMEVARVTGSFNIVPTSKLRPQPAALLRALQGISNADMRHFNVTHHIKRLSFGTDFPGQENPLDDVWTHSPGGAAVSRYFLKVVPTTYEFLDGHTVHTNQFSTTQYFKALDLAATTAMMPRRARGWVVGRVVGGSPGRPQLGRLAWAPAVSVVHLRAYAPQGGEKGAAGWHIPPIRHQEYSIQLGITRRSTSSKLIEQDKMRTAPARNKMRALGVRGPRAHRGGVWGRVRCGRAHVRRARNWEVREPGTWCEPHLGTSVCTGPPMRPYELRQAPPLHS